MKTRQVEISLNAQKRMAIKSRAFRTEVRWAIRSILFDFFQSHPFLSYRGVSLEAKLLHNTLHNYFVYNIELNDEKMDKILSVLDVYGFKYNSKIKSINHALSN